MPLPSPHEVCALYAGGASVRSIAKLHDAHRRHVRRMLAESGVGIRSVSEQSRASFIAMPPEVRTRRSVRMSQAARRQHNTPEGRRRLARGRQQEGRTSASQRVLCYVLQTKGYRPVMQAAIGEHNVDLLFPDCGLAVDVIAKHDICESGQPRLTARRAAAEAAGYTYITVWDAEMQGPLVDNVVRFVLEMVAAGFDRMQSKAKGASAALQKQRA